MNNKFFYYYLAAHLVVFSLLLGLVADAFTVLSGGGISVPTTNDSRAIVGNGVIDGVIANAATIAYLEQAKRTAGGCEMWNTDDYYRIKTWGRATTTYNLTPDTANCYCPSGFTKILISTSTSLVYNVHKPNDEWRSHYESTKNPPNYPICRRIAETDYHPPFAWDRGGCYVYPCSECCCDCDEAIGEESYYNNIISLRDDLQESSKFSYILRNYLFPRVLALDNTAHGCGLISLYHSNYNLFKPITSTNSTWVCVNTSSSSTITGWDN